MDGRAGIRSDARSFENFSTFEHILGPQVQHARLGVELFLGRKICTSQLIYENYVARVPLPFRLWSLMTSVSSTTR